MLAFVVGSATNFNYQKSERKSAIRAVEKLKNLETATRKKVEKIKNFDFSDCYDYSISDEIEGTNTKTALIQCNRNSLNSSQIFRDKAQEAKNNIVKEKILRYKQVIKWLDVLCSFMIIAGCFIALRENEKYQYENSNERVEVIKLIRDCQKINWKQLNFSQSQEYLRSSGILNFSNYNISYLKNETFVDFLNFTDYESLPIPHIISNDCIQLRWIILGLSLGSIPLIMLSRYLEYFRQYVYMSNLEGTSYFINYLFFSIL
jgi:hypothetical protein